MKKEEEEGDRSRRGTVGVGRGSQEEPYKPFSDTRTPGAGQRQCRRWAHTCLTPSINPTRQTCSRSL